MAASSSDFFTYVGNPGNATTLASPGHSVGGTTFNVTSTSNWPTTTGVFFAVDTVTISNGIATRVPGSYTVWEGVVSGSTTISNAVLRYGTDQNYAAGTTTRVYINIASAQMNRLIDGLQVAHNLDGTLKTFTQSNLVPTATIQDLAVTGKKIDFSTYMKVKHQTLSDTPSGTTVNGSTYTFTAPFTGILICKGDVPIRSNEGTTKDTSVAFRVNGVDLTSSPVAGQLITLGRAISTTSPIMYSTSPFLRYPINQGTSYTVTLFSVNIANTRTTDNCGWVEYTLLDSSIAGVYS